MKIFFIGCSLCFSIIANAQSTFQKLYHYISPFEETSANYLTACSDGGFIFSVSESGTGIIVFKTDSAGNTKWADFLPYSCQGYNVIETYDQSYIVAAYRNETMGIRLAPFMVKIDSTGNILWTRGYYTVNTLISTIETASVCQSNDSGYVLMSALPLAWNSTYDIVVTKTDSSGNPEWIKSYGSVGDEYGNSIIRVRPSGYIMLGYSNSFGNFSDFICKLDENGSVEWTRTAGTLNYFVGGQPVKQTFDNGYLILSGPNNIICKLDSNGNTLWSKTYTSNYDFYIRSVFETSDGKIAISGQLNDSIGLHAFIGKLDDSGNPLWTKFYNDSLSSGSAAATIVQTNDGGFAFSGQHYEDFTPYVLLVKTDSTGNLSCPGSSITGFQSNPINNPDSSIVLGSQSILLPDSSVLVNLCCSYTEKNFCFESTTTNLTQQSGISFSISPNPFHSFSTLTIGSNLKTDNATLTIRNILGEIVQQINFSGNEVEISRSKMSEGLYLYEVRIESGFIGTGKMIVE